MKYFCPLPFTALYANKGQVAPCCIYGKSSDYESYFTGADIKETKRQLLNNEFPENCSMCKINEDLTGQSMRTMANQFKTDSTENYHEDYFNIQHLSVTTSNVCNLLCLPCSDGSFNRSQELADLNLIYPKNRIPISFADKNLERFINLDITKLTLLGGEPFSDKVTFEYLYKLVDAGKSKNIRIDLNTNMTLVTEEKLEFLAKNFKEIFILASVDGVGPVNDYLRYPSNWQTIDKAVTLTQSFKEIELCITTALSNLSLLRYHEVIEWANSKNILDRFISIVNGPHEISLNVLPVEIKQKLLPIYEKLKTATHHSNRSSESLDLCISV